jgi:hypothetical protein
MIDGAMLTWPYRWRMSSPEVGPFGIRSRLADLRERSQRRRAVIDAVRARSQGRAHSDISRSEIEADLARSFADAGIPQLPESVAISAGSVIDGAGATGLSALAKGIDAIRTGTWSSGLGLVEQRVEGDRWVRVPRSDDRLTRGELRSWAHARDTIFGHVMILPKVARERLAVGPAARLTLVPPHSASPSAQVGVFLSDNFVGALSAADADADAVDLFAVIRTAEAAHRRVTVQARIDSDAAGYVIFVALP